MNLLHQSSTLLGLVLLQANAVSARPRKKTFHFKDDFFLKFDPLVTAMGPENKPVLMSALEDYAQDFKDAWIQELESTLEGGTCIVDVSDFFTNATSPLARRHSSKLLILNAFVILVFT